jgi:hypothetical protein
MRQYKEFTGKKEYAGSFTVDDEAVLIAGLVGHEIARGDFILVSHNIIEYPVLDSLSDWKAKVLEVHTLDAEHVCVRVGWLNRPEDLKNGRQGHHGKKELMPTNQIDVINALVVSGTFQLKHYDELTAHDQKDTPVEDEYFWKQTFDFTTQSLSVRLIVNSLRWDMFVNNKARRSRVTCIDHALWLPTDSTLQWLHRGAAETHYPEERGHPRPPISGQPYLGGPRISHASEDKRKQC